MTALVSSETKPGRRLWFFVLLWVATVFAALVALFYDQTVVFDDAGRVSGAYPNVAGYLAALQSQVSTGLPNDKAVIIRITEAGCPCNIGSSGHWQEMQQKYDDTLFIEQPLKSAPSSLQALIPATPMALYLDSQGQLLYAGPFSQGVLCNSNNSLVEAYVTGEIRQHYAPLDAAGCYCSLR
ncbi:DUF6436 domain-containing protein [Reinekea blandensis]|uniref:DUF6436 domain-containing protein n=1 Tax=Reinekea blandensis MED297 TaxID=314283 RepID=A4B8Y0_9GAMM|nr:DUF6436 domain-containing protein [Reinekea blandensis]EAR11081.1 hypothetical protein MED297_19377 [Reinekea sp. MED297] [Reinekea blandensis MED297]